MSIPQHDIDGTGTSLDLLEDIIGPEPTYLLDAVEPPLDFTRGIYVYMFSDLTAYELYQYQTFRHTKTTTEDVSERSLVWDGHMLRWIEEPIDERATYVLAMCRGNGDVTHRVGNTYRALTDPSDASVERSPPIPYHRDEVGAWLSAAAIAQGMYFNWQTGHLTMDAWFNTVPDFYHREVETAVNKAWPKFRHMNANDEVFYDFAHAVYLRLRKRLVERAA